VTSWIGGPPRSRGCGTSWMPPVPSDYGERKAASIRPAMTPDTRADRDTIRAAAAAVRSTAIADQYAGTRGHPAAAFSMAAVLDELALHAASLPEDLRRAVVAACWEIIKGEGWQDRRS
jgi:hypothetical protein